MWWMLMETFIPLLWLINLKRYKQSILSKQNIWGVFHKKISGGKINGNIYIHCSASTDHGFGRSRIFLVCAIQFHPFVRLLVDWVSSGFGKVGEWPRRRGCGWFWWRKGCGWFWWRRGTSLLNMIPHRAWLSRDALHVSFLCTAQTSTTLYLKIVSSENYGGS
jgi:hypothetical protein